MLISDILRQRKTIVSCEIFPPKKNAELENVFEIAKTIASFSPAFISVTCAAGHNTAANTETLAQQIEDYGVPALAHITCTSTPIKEIPEILNFYAEKGIVNVLALRGDLPKGISQNEDGYYTYANELVAAIKQRGGFCIGAACYPEGHVESVNQDDDIAHLKQKVDAGCDFLTTQMFFDNSVLYKFLYKLAQKGINAPVLAGIMPVTNKAQIKRILELSGTSLPPRFVNIVDKFGDKPSAMKQAGIAYATEQIIDLIANDVRGIHIYTMNKSDVAAGIIQNICEII